jgi:hypothetical protein
VDGRTRAGVILAGLGLAALVASRRRSRDGVVRRAVTVNLPQAEVAARWDELRGSREGARFEAAPGDRGTEVTLEARGRSKAALEDDLRHFKQLVEAGEVARSDSSEGGESLVRQLLQRAAQPVASR